MSGVGEGLRVLVTGATGFGGRRLVPALIEAGHAYEADGHVLFDVPSYERYGALSGNSRDEIVAGARVDVAPYKKDAADFVLWKPSTGDLPGWDSPWGHGRPGWHLECSAMSKRFLGQSFDIHGGARDLISLIKSRPLSRGILRSVRIRSKERRSSQPRASSALLAVTTSSPSRVSTNSVR